MNERLVEVSDGVRLDLRRSGVGSPSVVCLSCAGGGHDEWSDVATQLAEVTQVLTYGRPTLGGSDPLPSIIAECTQSIGWAAAQLRTLLEHAGVDPPHVLVTSSVGSWIADQFAVLWPEEVAGMVLIDPTTLGPWPQIVEMDDQFLDGSDDGCIRFSWELSYAELRSSVPVRSVRCVVLSSSDGRWERDPPAPQYNWWDPLTLPEVDQLWQGFQREWAQRWSAVHVVADTAGHFVHRDEPRLVAHVVTAVVEAARADEPVRLDTAGLAAVSGRLEPGESRDVVDRNADEYRTGLW